MQPWSLGLTSMQLLKLLCAAIAKAYKRSVVYVQPNSERNALCTRTLEYEGADRQAESFFLAYDFDEDPAMGHWMSCVPADSEAKGVIPKAINRRPKTGVCFFLSVV
jgi:hypothetical protein